MFILNKIKKLKFLLLLLVLLPFSIFFLVKNQGVLAEQVGPDYSLNVADDGGVLTAMDYLCVGDCPKAEGLLGDANACKDGVVPFPRMGVFNSVYPYSKISSKQNSKGETICTIPFNMGYVGGTKREDRCHVGLDLYPLGGDPARFITDGKILRLTNRWNGEPENVLCGADVLTQDASGREFVIRYGEVWCPATQKDRGGHFASLAEGQRVKAGQYLGTTGNVGAIHIELHLYQGLEKPKISAGKWILKTYVPGRSYNARYCAMKVGETNLCNIDGGETLLNVFGVLKEAAENSKSRGEPGFKDCDRFIPENPYTGPFYVSDT